MLDIIFNPIVTHLLAAFAGAGGAWYATHKTAVKTAVSVVETAAATVKADVGKV